MKNASDDGVETKACHSLRTPTSAAAGLEREWRASLPGMRQNKLMMTLERIAFPVANFSSTGCRELSSFSSDETVADSGWDCA